MRTTGTVEHPVPEGLPRNPAFSNVVAVSGPVKTVYIGGQNAVDGDGNLVGEGDIAAQTAQIFDNLEACLAAAGAELRHIVKWNILVVDGTDIRPALAVFQQRWDGETPPPVITVATVANVARPGMLAEIEAIAVVPE